MPNTASAKKRLRQNKARKVHNHSIKSTVRSTIRKVREAISSGDAAECEALFKTATKQLDQAAAKNVFHANKAARIKSRLSKAIKDLKS